MVKQLRRELKGGAISLQALSFCMNSEEIGENAVAFEVLTDTSAINRIAGFVAERKHPEFCLGYLLKCIEYNFQASSESLVYGRADALFELTVPLGQFWENRGVALSNDFFWDRVEEMLKKMAPLYIGEFVTHFLEGADPNLEFRRRLGVWRANPVLRAYLKDLERTLHFDGQQA